MSLPLFDCRLDAAAIASMRPAMAAGQLASGPDIPALEAALSVRMGGRPVVALSDSTQALELALRCAGIGQSPDDEVLTLSYNCMSSNSAIAYVGARPVWVDIEPTTASIDISDAKRRLTPATRAVVVYHVAGYPADLDALRRLCDDHDLLLIEDANAAIGAVLADGRAIGTVGDYAVFSFYANRIVNAIEGAALVCPDEATAHKIRALRRFGIDQTQFRDPFGEISAACDIPDIGLPATMPNAHAALAVHQLALLDERLARTRANANRIVSALAGNRDIQVVVPIAEGKSAYWVMLLLCNERDTVLSRLKAAGIGCSKLHQPNHIYSGFATAEPAQLPGTAQFMDHVLAVPCGWWMAADDCDRLVNALAY